MAKTKRVIGRFLERTHHRQGTEVSSGHVTSDLAFENSTTVVVAQIPHSPLRLQFTVEHYKVIFFPMNLIQAGHAAKYALVAHHNV